MPPAAAYAGGGANNGAESAGSDFVSMTMVMVG